MLLLVVQVILGMFLIHVIFLVNYDLSRKNQNKHFYFLLNNIITRNEPVEATLALAIDANDPILG